MQKRERKFKIYYKRTRATKIKTYDRIAKGSLCFAGGMAALCAGNKFNLFPGFLKFDAKYFGIGCFMGLFGAYYGYHQKQQSIRTLPLNLPEQKVEELLKDFEKSQNKHIQEVCHLQ